MDTNVHKQYKLLQQSPRAHFKVAHVELFWEVERLVPQYPVTATENARYRKDFIAFGKKQDQGTIF